MARLKSRPYVPYDEAFSEFTNLRREFNAYAEKSGQKFLTEFEKLKVAGARENTVAMDLLAYYYKSGVGNFLDENYSRYIHWEMLSASRGNQLAIEKLQFLIGYACDIIMDHEKFNLIMYKNDIDENNVLYVLGKAIAKIYVREYKIYPIDLYALKDESKPFKKEYFSSFRHQIDQIIPKTVEYLLS